MWHLSDPFHSASSGSSCLHKCISLGAMRTDSFTGTKEVRSADLNCADERLSMEEVGSIITITHSCFHYYNLTQLPQLIQSHKGRWWCLGLRAWDCCTACKYNIFNSMSSIWEICRCWKCFSVEAIECPIHVIMVNFEQHQMESFRRFDLNSILFSTFMDLTIGNVNSIQSWLKSSDFILSLTFLALTLTASCAH